jgi:hypothetical protein
MAKKTNLKLKRPQLRQPSTAPIDAVRNPNFDSAMAEVNYRNSLAQSLANYRAQNYPTGATKQLSDIEARTGAPIQTVGNQDFIDSRDPNKMYTQDMVDYIDPSTGEKASRTRGVVPAPGSRFVPANQAGLINELQRNQNPIGGLGGQQSTNPMAGYMPVDPNTNMPRLMPIQTPGSNALNQDLANRGMGGGIPAPMPQASQGATADQYQNPQGAQAAMADYNKMLQQGMQRNQDMNQAAQNFAGMGGPQRSFSQVVGGIRRINRTPRQPRSNAIPLPKTRTI